MSDEEADARLKIGDLYDGAAELFRFFGALKVSGFEPNEALYLVGQVLTARLQNKAASP